MVETTENQTSSPLNLFKPTLLCVALLVPSVVLTCVLGLGFYQILFTIPILILSTSFLVTFTKNRKLVVVEKPGCRNLKVEDEVVQPVVPMESVLESGAAQEADIGMLNEFQVESLDLTTESESSDENLELNWMISGDLEQNPEVSGDSTSEDDEGGLIEIAIPSNDSTGLSEEPKENLPESISKQQELAELMAEMNEANEEENLIEIDISMGSIKCPRLEIEA